MHKSPDESKWMYFYIAIQQFGKNLGEAQENVDKLGKNVDNPPGMCKSTYIFSYSLFPFLSVNRSTPFILEVILLPAT
jgi:hypothetical protein